MSQFVRNVLNEQRKRVIASIMTTAENSIFPSLDRSQQQELRSKVIAAVSQYHDTCLDLVKASVDEGAVINDEAVRLIAAMARDVRHLRREY